MPEEQRAIRPSTGKKSFMNRMPGHGCKTKTQGKAKLLGPQNTTGKSEGEVSLKATDLWLLSYDLGRLEALLSGF